MKKINFYVLALAIWDLLRFGILIFFLVPIFARIFDITATTTLTYRLLLWFSTPQLIIPLYLGAVSIGIIADGLIKQLGIVLKILSLIPGLIILITLIATFFSQNIDKNVLHLFVRLGFVLLFDLIFLIMLAIYRKKQLEE